jgi:hypothetical protein
MSSPDSPQNALDYSSIRFPSDRITMADIRRSHPGRFDAEVPEAFSHTDAEPGFTLNAVIYAERLLAQAAFEKANGNPIDVIQMAGLERDECIETLAEQYRQYGVAEGLQHTVQLVRDIESQATAQAGRGR